MMRIFARAMLILVPAAWWSSTAGAEAAACVYRSQNYSEGAAVCVEAGLMLSCTASGERLVWKVAREPDLSALCRKAAPGVQRSAHTSRRVRRHGLVQRTPPSSAKCFAFNGKTYCE